MDILQRLPVKDILTMRRVSTRLKMVAREREIWEGAVIWMDGLYYDKDYNGSDESREPTGRKLVNLNYVTTVTEELAWLVCRARVAVIKRSNLTHLKKIQIIQKILHNIVEERQEEMDLLQRKRIVQLETLDMSNVNLGWVVSFFPNTSSPSTCVDSQLFAKAIVGVKRVNITNTRLFPDHVNILCRTIIEEEESVKKLETLNISNVDLAFVDKQLAAHDVIDCYDLRIIEENQLLAHALVRVKSVDISYTKLRADKVNTLFRTILEEEESVKKLESIKMSGVDLCHVDSKLLANAVVRVKCVNIEHTNLTQNQVDTICQTIIEKDQSLLLEDLRISQHVDWSRGIGAQVTVSKNVKDRVEDKVKNVVGLHVHCNCTCEYICEQAFI